MLIPKWNETENACSIRYSADSFFEWHARSDRSINGQSMVIVDGGSKVNGMVINLVLQCIGVIFAI